MCVQATPVSKLIGKDSLNLLLKAKENTLAWDCCYAMWFLCNGWVDRMGWAPVTTVHILDWENRRRLK